VKRVLIAVGGCKVLSWLFGFFVPWTVIALNDGSFPVWLRYSAAAIGVLGLILGLISWSADWLVSAIVKDAGWSVEIRKASFFREHLVLSKGAESFEAGSYYHALEKVLGIVPL